MKIAIVHDYIKEYGGAERVVEVLHEMYPDAPVYTAFYSPQYLGPHRKRLENWDIRTTWLQYVPFKNKLLSYFRFIAPFVFSRIDLSGYDIVITSQAGTYTSPNLIKIGKNTKLLCYCHTPPRYLYGFATAAPWKTLWWRKIIYFFGRLPMVYIRKADMKAAKRPDVYIANSENVAGRIKKFYKRDAVVVYPPVDVVASRQSLVSRDQRPKTKDYYVAGGRLARPKHIDLAVKAAIEMGFSLKVFGKEFSGYGEELRSLVIASGTKQSDPEIASLVRSVDMNVPPRDDVEFLGEITDEEKNALLAGAKAYIFPADDEDFGMLPVEAMGMGTPVIAYRSGGPKESVVEGKTGVFFDDLTVKSLIDAIKKLETLHIKPEDCIQQAEKFSKEAFIKKMKSIILNTKY